MPDGDSPDTTYDLSPAAPPVPARAPVAVPPPPTNRTLQYRGRAPDEKRTALEPDAIKSLYMPLWLLGGGVLVETIAAFLRARTDPRLATIGVLVNVGLGTVLMLVGLTAAAYLRGIKLGPIGSTLLKLAALSVAPDAALLVCTPFLDHIPLGWLLGLIGEFVLYFALLGVLFDLDESDTWYCVWTIFVVRLAVVVLALYLAH